MARKAQFTMDLTESLMEEEAPSQVTTAELQHVTQLIAEGRRLAGEMRRQAQTPSLISRAMVAQVLLIRKECMEWGEKASDHLELKFRLRQSKAGKATDSSPASGTAPVQPLAASWPPASQALAPESADARASAAEAAAAAAMAWASAAVGHEAAAEAAETRAAAQPAAQQAAAAAEWAQAAAAWRAAFDALEAAAQADPGPAAVKKACAAVREARSFKSQRAGLNA